MGIASMLFDTEQGMTRLVRQRVRPGVYAFIALTVFISTLSGCAGNNQRDLVAYVKAVKARKAGHIPPLPEFKSYESYTYKADNLRDPFQPGREEASIKPTTGKGGPEPNLNRNKQPLEAFPLDGLKFVGLLQKGKTTWGIVTAPDGFVYRVQVGNYMGQNYGKIVRITASQIDIRELVPNGLGGWVARSAKLALTE